MRPNRFQCALVAVFSVATLGRADDALVPHLYISAKRAYFAGEYKQAHEFLSNAIAGKTSDPRVFYFRGLANWQMGRSDDAKRDFCAGADLEARATLGMYDIGGSLEHVQGQPRFAIEEARRVVSEKRKKEAQTAATAAERKNRIAEKRPSATDDATITTRSAEQPKSPPVKTTPTTDQNPQVTPAQSTVSADSKTRPVSPQRDSGSAPRRETVIVTPVSKLASAAQSSSAVGQGPPGPEKKKGDESRLAEIVESVVVPLAREKGASSETNERQKNAFSSVPPTWTPKFPTSPKELPTSPNEAAASNHADGSEALGIFVALTSLAGAVVGLVVGISKGSAALSLLMVPVGGVVGFIVGIVLILVLAISVVVVILWIIGALFLAGGTTYVVTVSRG